MKEIELTNSDEVVIVDDADYGDLSGYEWRLLTTTTGSIYAVTHGGKNTILMHRYLTTPKYKEVVIHLNHDTLDNRKENLLSGSWAQVRVHSNLWNSSSGFRGVHWCPRKKKYRACYGQNRKSLHIGYFETAQEAADAFDNVMFSIYGDLAVLNKTRRANSGKGD